MNNSLLNLAKKTKHYIFSKNLHRGSKKLALQALSNIEEHKGKTDPELIRLCDEYAERVLGGKEFAPWLYVYSAISGNFKEGWLPDNYYGAIVVPKISSDYGEICDLRSLSHLLFGSKHFPEAAFQVNGQIYNTSKEAMSESSLKNLLFKNAEVAVFKADNSLQGIGVHLLKPETFNFERIKSLGNGVFQEYIKQHEIFKKMTPDSVATLRITTAINSKGECSVRAAYLRLGRSNDTHVTSANHIRIPVDVTTGELSKDGFLPDWRVIDRHPDSSEVFSGKKIPAYEECLSAVLSLHKKMPFVRCMGWDLCVDQENQVKIMEWNGGHNDIKFTEATQGPCFTELDWDKL